ncbi:hypothetical protein DZA29_01950 [Citrobacter gillenii]|nr:hypothetical protein DZA29_01950 [Citrobacter gillenii]
MNIFQASNVELDSQQIIIVAKGHHHYYRIAASGDAADDINTEPTAPAPVISQTFYLSFFDHHLMKRRG